MTSCPLITFQKSFNNSKSTQNIILKYQGLGVAYTHASVLILFFIIICYKISNLIGTYHTVGRRWLCYLHFLSNKIFLQGTESQKFYQRSYIAFLIDLYTDFSGDEMNFYVNISIVIRTFICLTAQIFQSK